MPVPRIIKSMNKQKYYVKVFKVIDDKVNNQFLNMLGTTTKNSTREYSYYPFSRDQSIWIKKKRYCY